MKPQPCKGGYQFLKSVVDLSHLPPDKGCEVAFIGRSNAGKSSAINAITGIRGLARTSSTPGHTQMINFFITDEPNRRLVDLPGYGYAKVPRTTKERWQKAIHQYLETRTSLKGLILVMDIRHPLKESDQQLISWTVKCAVPVHILLTKADKLSHAEAKKVLKEVVSALNSLGPNISVQIFSAMELEGKEQAQSCLDQWLGFP
ncbi:MAG: YihA family ribosome biogenesis GTP-binding protein [Proteobacteria bacterium]|nr:YihA family ribosome biogenesis GTP-binding protein [Pseudomonadota bacterium]